MASQHGHGTRDREYMTWARGIRSKLGARQPATCLFYRVQDAANLSSYAREAIIGCGLTVGSTGWLLSQGHDNDMSTQPYS